MRMFSFGRSFTSKASNYRPIDQIKPTSLGLGIGILPLATLCLIIITQLACNKEPVHVKGTLHGQVIDKLTKEPVAGAQILFLVQDKCVLEDYDPCWTMLDSTSYVSDTEGKFQIDYDLELRKLQKKEPFLGVKPIKDGHFIREGFSRDENNGMFKSNTDSLKVEIWPKAYLLLEIKDETRDPDIQYDGIRLSNSFFTTDSIFQYPLDTTVVIEVDPFVESPLYDVLDWGLFNLDLPMRLLLQDRTSTINCPPHDTCIFEIKF